MKITITYILLMIALSMQGQESDTNLKPDSISYFYKIDNDTFQGKFSFDISKSGFISQFRRLVYKKTNLQRPLPLTKETEFNYEIQIVPIFSGELKNGMKTGTWTYFSDTGTDYSWEHTIFEDHSTTFKTDTTVYQTFKTLIIYVRDSMYIYGHTLTRSDYFINFECKNKKECIFWNESKDAVIETSKYSDFEFIIARFEYGEYDKKIKLLQNE